MDFTFSIYKIIGALGLIGIIVGNLFVSSKRKNLKKYIYPSLLFGGICLEIYSIYIQDIIFIILQFVFIIASVYGLIHYKPEKEGEK